MAEELPKMERSSARFVDRDLERIFQKENFELTVRRYVRFSVPLAVAGIFSYGIHDYLVLPEMRTTAWLIRFGFFGPIGLLGVLFVFRNRKWERHQLAMLAFSLGAVTAVVWVASVARTDAFFLYIGFSVIFVTLGHVAHSCA